MTEAEEVKPNERAQADSGQPPTDDPEQLKAQLEEEKGKAQSYLANWQRAAADFQNYKRRVEQERQEAARMANAALLINILTIVDDLERALASLDTRLVGLTWFEGIALILRKLQMVLENAGVSEIRAEGETFDPRYHEALMQAEGEEGKVLSVVQKGYTLGDRVLRPAMVIVGKGRAKAEPEQQEQADSQNNGS